jgi:hypothetical protein
MDRRYFSRDFNDSLVDTFQIYMKDLTKIEAARKEITEKFGKKYDLYVLSNIELRKEAYDLVSNAFAVTYAMEGVAVTTHLDDGIGEEDHHVTTDATGHVAITLNEPEGVVVTVTMTKPGYQDWTQQYHGAPKSRVDVCLTPSPP